MSSKGGDVIPVYRHLARRFRAEGIDTVFVLTGDGNMFWEAAFADLQDTRSIHVRHEHCAVAMATAYARKSEQLGVASVTHGPGLTQIMTALATAVRARIPLVVHAGETALGAAWNNQWIDQAPLVRATGAEYVAVHSLDTLDRQVSLAFHTARTELRPVVLAFPVDLQDRSVSVAHSDEAAADLDVRTPRPPHPADIARAADRLQRSSRPVLLAGRGAVLSGAADACVALAEACDGALATTLPVRGLFAGHPRSIGVVGGYAHPVTKQVVADADLVLAVGASLTEFTSGYGTLFRPEQVLQIDERPTGVHNNNVVASELIAADARLGVAALLEQLRARQYTGCGWDVTGPATRIRTEPPDSREFAIEDGLVDPRQAVAVLHEVIPHDWECVNGAGHSGYFAAHMPDRPASRFLTIREFGAVGNGLSYAAGVAVARPHDPVVLFEGDGGVMMHMQELETVRRYGMRILICVLNDGAFGSEVHKLRALGLNTSGAIYGRNDIAGMARGMGVAGLLITRVQDLPPAVEAFAAGTGPMLLDIQISDRVMSPGMHRRFGTPRVPGPSV